MNARRARNDEIDESERGEYPPETAKLLSWASVKFIRAPSSRFLLWTVVGLGGAFAATLVLSNFVAMDVGIEAPGETTSDFGTRTSLSPGAGQITEIRKRRGDAVTENEVIATVAMGAKEEREIQAAIATLREIESNVLLADATGVRSYRIPALPTAKVAPGPARDALIQIEQQAKSVADIKSRIEAASFQELKPYRERASALEKKLKKIRESNQREYLEMYLESTEDELGKTRSQIATLENEARLKLEQSLGDFLKSARNAQAALEAYLSQRQMKSPIAGIVGQILAGENSWIDANKPFAVVVPKDGKLVAQIRVPSKDIVRVAPRQKVVFKMEAYPFQTYGAFPGEVISFEPAKTAASPPAAKESDKSRADSETDYVVFATIDVPPHLNAEIRERIKFVLGMKFRADIITDRKSIRKIIAETLFGKGVFK